MKYLMLLVVLISLFISPYIYNKYIKYRVNKIDIVRNYIYKHHSNIYTYLPSRNLMIYNLVYPLTIEYWINYCYNLKQKLK